MLLLLLLGMYRGTVQSKLLSDVQDQLEPPSYVSDRRLVKALAVMQVRCHPPSACV